MIPFEKAYEIALGAVRRLPAEHVPFTEIRGRVLAEPIRADMPMPPFDKAMVDGYACRRADLNEPLQLVETIPAGRAPERELTAGQCAKIMTGAMVPQGADCVFMVEHSESENGVVRFTGESTGDNIIAKARHVTKGDVLLHAGHFIGPHDVGVVASMGYTQPLMARQPRVGVLATGDELVEPEETPSISQIRNSNGHQLCAQLEAMGCLANYAGIARDTEESLQEHTGRAIASNDVVLLSGGVSMGDFDLVPGILKRNGVQIQFDKVAIQPGKPTVFGYSDQVFCFGLPGNPVSTFVIFEILVKPFLFAMMGHDYRPPNVAMPLEETISRKVATRKAWIPVVLTEAGKVRRIEYHGSAHINALSLADGLIPFPQGVAELPAGTVVPVRLMRH